MVHACLKPGRAMTVCCTPKRISIPTLIMMAIPKGPGVPESMVLVTYVAISKFPTNAMR